MSKVNPRVDIIFKKIFGVDENKDLLISLVNTFVSQEDQVVDVTLLNSYNLQEFSGDKFSILDIKAQGSNGRLFNVEIQQSREADYDKRALYYWTKLYTSQLQQKKDYDELSKAIVIHILKFIALPQEKKYHNVFHLREKDSGLVYFKDMELHTIELNKFLNDPKAQLKDVLKKAKTALDRWEALRSTRIS